MSEYKSLQGAAAGVCPQRQDPPGQVYKLVRSYSAVRCCVSKLHSSARGAEMHCHQESTKPVWQTLGVESLLEAQELPLRAEPHLGGAMLTAGSHFCSCASAVRRPSQLSAVRLRKEVPWASMSRRACRLLLEPCWARDLQLRSLAWGLSAPEHRAGGDTPRKVLGEGLAAP